MARREVHPGAVTAPVGVHDNKPKAQQALPLPKPSQAEYDDIYRRMVKAEAERQARGDPYKRTGWYDLICESDLAAMTAAGFRASWKVVYVVERVAMGPRGQHQLPRSAVAARAGVDVPVVEKARRAIRRLGLLDYKRAGRGMPAKVCDPYPRLFDRNPEADTASGSDALKRTPRPHLRGGGLTAPPEGRRPCWRVQAV